MLAITLLGEAYVTPYSFENYSALVPLPNDFTNGTTLLRLPSKLMFAIKTNPPPPVLVEATKRYTDIIFAWGAPTVSTTTEPTLTSVDISVDDPDDTFATLQLGMDESYSLQVPATSNGTALLHASTVWGALRGLETLAQMIEYHPPHAIRSEPHPGEYTLAWAPWRIEDYPRFQHRGIMFDTARHFLQVSTLLRQLDAMAAAKLNTMHLHLTDSQSVPIVSKSFPELAAKGAFGPAMIYSQQDMRKVVDYARYRGIRVVPEWDMPGHSDAWARGAPPGVLISCGSLTPLGQFQFDPTSEAAYAFLDTFFGDMDEVFPDKVWHLGGDEVTPSCLNQSATVQAYLRRNPSIHLDDLIPMFYTRTHQIAAKHGRAVTTWNDAFASIYMKADQSKCSGYNASSDPFGPGGNESCVSQEPLHQSVNASLPSDAIVQAWNSGCFVEYAMLSPVQKFRSILSTGYYMNSGGTPNERWEVWYDPDPSCVAPSACVYYLPEEQQQALLGVEMCLWGEEEDDFTIDKQLWLRASIVGERIWSTNATITAASDAGADWTNPDINSRMIKHRCRLMQRGIHPEAYVTGILPFESKWQQCGGWLPQSQTQERAVEARS